MTVAEFESRYYRFLDDETRAKVDALDPGDRAYLWAYLKETLPAQMGRELLHEMERQVIEGMGGVMRDEASAKPFSHAEGRLRPGAWFSRTCIQ